MDAKDRLKDITFTDEAHLSIQKGVDIMKQAVGSTYGPGGRNVLIKKAYVAPIQTRDGVTVARDIAGFGNKLKDPIATTAAQLVYQASEKTNKTAGDGTTATVVLLAELYKAGYRRIVAGEDAMTVKRILDRDREAIVKFVESKSQKVDKKKLDQVAFISSGNEALGSMISDLVYDVGADGAITIAYHNAPHVEVEKVTGYLLNKGFSALAGEVEIEEPIVMVSQKRIATKADIIPILECIAKNQKQAVIIADVSGAALDTVIWAVNNNKADAVVLPPPAYGADGHDYFEDLATYTGAHLFMESDNFKEIKLDDFGTVKGVRANRDRAILFGDNATGDAIAARIAKIQEQMKSTDMTPSLKEVLETRAAKLAGKISIIKVGAATDAEREELFFRVEDAVEACKSALSSGIVAGGATTLLFASEMRAVEGGVIGNDPKLPLVLEPFVRDALQQPFRLLMSNAGEDGGYRKGLVLDAGYGKGFNLRNMTDQPTDLIKDGIVDATKVVLQTVQNAFSIAGVLLTTGAVIVEDESNDKQA